MNSPIPRYYYTATAGNVISAFPQIYDPTIVLPNAITGGWRAYSTADVAALTVSGLSVTVNNVAVTGGAISINNNLNTNVIGGFLGITGIVNVLNQDTGIRNVINQDTGIRPVVITNGILPVSGNVIINSGIFTPVFSGIINTGQLVIPANAKKYRIYVESGSAVVNGWTYNASTSVDGGGYDGGRLLSSSIAIGTTGVSQRVLVNWET